MQQLTVELCVTGTPSLRAAKLTLIGHTNVPNRIAVEERLECTMRLGLAELPVGLQDGGLDVQNIYNPRMLSIPNPLSRF